MNGDEFDRAFRFRVGTVANFRVASETGDSAVVVVLCRSLVQFGDGPPLPSYRVAWVDDRERRTAEVYEVELDER